jgi:3-isopropylmalate/(R)-2-methylmalate dehydratase small subunit
MKYAGVNCVLAESFARIFFRNSINIGLPVIECEGISKLVSNDDELTVDLIEGTIQNNSKNKKIKGNKLPEFIIEILNDGGLIDNLHRRLNK